jgi:hypothetical protein
MKPLLILLGSLLLSAYTLVPDADSPTGYSHGFGPNTTRIESTRSGNYSQQTIYRNGLPTSTCSTISNDGYSTSFCR